MSNDPVTYLPNAPFSESGDCSVTVDAAGVIVYSECCSERMSGKTMCDLYEALGRFIGLRLDGSPKEMA